MARTLTGIAGGYVSGWAIGDAVRGHPFSALAWGALGLALLATWGVLMWLEYRDPYGSRR